MLYFFVRFYYFLFAVGYEADRAVSAIFLCSLPVSVPTSVPLPVPTFVNGCRTSKPCPILQTSQDFDTDIIGDDLDDLLDQAGPESPTVSQTVLGLGVVLKYSM